MLRKLSYAGTRLAKTASKTFLTWYLIVTGMVYPISRLIISPVYRLWLRKADGRANIPKNNPFIVAANHVSYFETLLLPIIIVPETNKKIHALVNSYYWGNFFTRYFLNLWECIPVFVEKSEKDRSKNKKAFKVALNWLKKNEIIMIFPEGKRGDGRRLQKGYTGVARLALQSKAPVLPVGVIGSDKVMPKGASFPRFARCEVKIGKPMRFPQHYNKKINEKALHEVTRSIMKEIAKLIGQEYDY